MSSKRHAVVGGGVSGIAAAYYLWKQGLEVELLERDSCLGGRVGPGMLGDRPIELGGKNIGRRYQLFREFARDFGDPPYEPFGISSSRIRDGRIVRMEGTRRIALELMRGVPKAEVLRFLRLCARVRLDSTNRFLGSAYFGALGQRFDSAPLSAHFSQAFCDAVLRPLTVRMNAAEPDEVYLGTLGTNIGLLLDSYDQLQSGMTDLLARFARMVPVRLGTTVQSVLIEDGRVAGLRVTTADGALEEHDYAGVVVATPAPLAATLLAQVPALADRLSRVQYWPVTVIVAEYEGDVFSPEVRALLFGPGEPLSNAGAYGIHALNLVRYTFSGRGARRYLEAGWPPERLLELAEETLNRHVPVTASRRRAFAARAFEPGLCAYAPAHLELLADLHRELSQLRGLALAGDYLKGASIEACFHSAREAVASLRGSRVTTRRVWNPSSESPLGAGIPHDS